MEVIKNMELDARQVALIELCIVFAKSHRGEFQTWLGHRICADELKEVSTLFTEAVAETKKMRWNFKPGTVIGSNIIILGDDAPDEVLPEANVFAKVG